MKSIYFDKKLHIFDLDDTLILWKHRSPDYERKVKEMLIKLKNSGKILALASHNRSPRFYLVRMGVNELFDIVIGEYPRDKDNMVQKILQETGCDIKDAIFYDDQMHNIEKVKALGVESYHVKENGIEFELVI